MPNKRNNRGKASKDVKSLGVDNKNINNSSLNDEKANSILDEAFNSRQVNDSGDRLITSSSKVVGNVLPGPETFSEIRDSKKDGTVMRGENQAILIDLNNDVSGAPADAFSKSTTQPLAAANTKELLEQSRLAASEGLRKVIPTKELLVAAYLGPDAERYDADLDALSAALIVGQDEVRKIRSENLEIRRIGIGSPNLEVITSNKGRTAKCAIIRENVGFMKIKTGINKNIQCRKLAKALLDRYGLTSPFVIDISNMVETVVYDNSSYSTAGYDYKQIVEALNATRRFRGMPELQPRELTEIRSDLLVTDGPDRTSISTLYDGTIKAQIIKAAAYEWEQDIITLPEYIRRIKMTIPEGYRIKEYSPKEMRYGKVYYRFRQASLRMLLDMLGDECSDFFIKRLYLDIKHKLPATSSSTTSVVAAIAPDVRVSSTTTSLANSFLSALKLTDIENVRALSILCAVFKNLQIEINFTKRSGNAGIMDMLAATFALLFFPDHSISDALYLSILKVIASFLGKRAIQDYSDYNSVQMRDELIGLNWPFINRCTPEQLELEGSPFFSNGEIGRYDIPLNINARGKHVLGDISRELRAMSRERWRDNNSSVGLLVSSVLKFAISACYDVFDTHIDVAAHIRAMVPNEVAEMLDHTRGTYQIQPSSLVSYIMHIGKWEITDTFVDEIDVMAEKRLSEYHQLALDISEAINITRTIISETKPTNARRLAYTNAVVRYVDHMWGKESADGKQGISSTLGLLLGAAAGADLKSGYKRFLNDLCTRNDATPADEPLYRIMESVTRIVESNLSAFGITEEILICPKRHRVETDARFNGIFRQSPFVATMPVEYRRVLYTDLLKMGALEAAKVISVGVIVYGVPFNYEYRIHSGDSSAVSEKQFVNLDTNGVTLGELEWDIYFDNGHNVVAECDDIFGLGYKTLIVTPPNLQPIDNYNEYKVKYTSADDEAIYINDHIYMYKRT
nr:VP2 [Kadipiro virus]